MPRLQIIQFDCLKFPKNYSSHTFVNTTYALYCVLIIIIKHNYVPARVVCSIYPCILYKINLVNLIFRFLKRKVSIEHIMQLSFYTTDDMNLYIYCTLIQ